VSVLSDATFAEVEQSEILFRSFDEAAKPYKRLLDIYVSKFFGLKRAEHFLRVYGTSAIAADPKTMNAADAAVYTDALKLSDEKRFFHWDLEFPEVFIDLENASWKENPGFDAVFGNPPYVRQEGLGEIKPFLQAQYKSYHGVADLYVYFIERGLSSLKEGGQFSFIVSNKFMRANYGKPLRHILTTQSSLREIVDFGELPVFSEAATFPVVLTLEKGELSLEAQEPTVTKIKSLNFNDLEVEVNQSCYQVNQSGLLSEGWSLAEEENANVLVKMKLLSTSLSDFVDNKMYRGIVTGCNEAFFINQFEYDQIVSFDPKSKALIKPLTVGDNVRHYEINQESKYLIFTRRGVQLDEYPGIKKHLEKFRARLEPRPRDFKGSWSGRKPGNYKWYEIQDSIDYWEVFEQPKIIYPDITITSRFSIDETDNYIDCTAFVIPESNFYLLALLNSTLLFTIVQQSAAVLGDADQGGRVRLKRIYMKNLPIRKINFTTPPDRRQQALQNAIALYDQLQLNHNVDPLLAQVNHHLIQQPEEADVIHDLLAHLAEQMIELNKQKQTEIKSFLHWLERFIGCPIDTLTNKSKIQNYLGDYYKKGTGIADTDNDTGAPHLSFNDLIELLKKNKKKIKIDPVARKEQQTLEKEYQASLETLLPLKMQLMRCDRLIDAIVYRLYGLTEEEIAIVEGRDKQQERGDTK